MSRILWPATMFVICCAVAAAQELPTQPPPQPAPLVVDPWVLHSRLTQEVLPNYPKEARDHNIKGDVAIDVVVDQQGNVASAKWIKTSGTSMALSEEALEAVKQWKYQPTLVDGKPVAVASWIVIRFQPEATPNVIVLTSAESSTPAKKPAALKGPLKLRIVSGVSESNLVHKVEPHYPSEARAEGIQGDAVLQIIIGQQGDVIYIRPVRGPSSLTKAAVDAVRQWKYKPYLLNGEPVEVETTITVKFRFM